MHQLLISLVCFCLCNLLHGQRINYSKYLQVNKQSIISNNYGFDSVNLKNNYMVSFSKNDTLMFVNLINKDTIFPLYEEYISSGLKKMGGLCSDFDSAFFWGYSMGNHIYCRLYKKENRLVFTDEYIFICIKKIKGANIVLLANPNYEDDISQLYLYGYEQPRFIVYKLSKKIHPTNLKYLRIIKYDKKRIILQNIKDKKLYSLIP